MKENGIIIHGCKRIVGGKGVGKVVSSTQPLNFLAMVDARAGTVTDRSSELYGKQLAGCVLAFPFSIGSSVGAYVFHSLRTYGRSPAAIVCSRSDITTASGCAIAKIPLVDLPGGEGLERLQDGMIVIVNADEQTIIEKL